MLITKKLWVAIMKREREREREREKKSKNLRKLYFKRIKTSHFYSCHIQFTTFMYNVFTFVYNVLQIYWKWWCKQWPAFGVVALSKFFSQPDFLWVQQQSNKKCNLLSQLTIKVGKCNNIHWYFFHSFVSLEMCQGHQTLNNNKKS